MILKKTARAKGPTSIQKEEKVRCRSFPLPSSSQDEPSFVLVGKGKRKSKRKDLMGVCYGTPDFATPSFTGSLKSNMKLTISSSSSEGCGLDRGGEVPKILPLPNLTVFTLAEIHKATRFFDRDSMIGEGGYGLVYKGRIGTGELVAVKKLRKSAIQGLREWQNEVNYLGRIDHPNIVKLLGYCLEDKEEPLLVYEFVQKGSLDNHLFGRGAVAHPLTWEARVKIALGAAKGLAFLHSSEMKIILRDFKTSNILLDATYTAKLSDFGLARPGPPEGESHIKTRVIGTHGYAAPEYIATGCLYIASDVYSYGVVLLEMLTGLRAIDKHRPKGKHNLVEWSNAYLYSRKKIINVVDPNLKGEYPIPAAMQMAKLALECLEPSPKIRPPMSDVVERLEEIAASSRKLFTRVNSI